MLTVLPMGLNQSSMYFDVAMKTLLAKLGPVDSAVSLLHYQDDVIVMSTTEEGLEGTKQRLMDLFDEFGFKIRPEKCEQGTSIKWCGYQVDENGGIQPAIPKTLPILEKSFKQQLNQLNSLEEIISYMNSWFGIANVGHKWLSSKIREEIAECRKMISKARKGEAGICVLKEHALKCSERIIKFWNEEIRGQWISSPEDPNISVAFADANQNAWFRNYFCFGQV